MNTDNALFSLRCLQCMHCNASTASKEEKIQYKNNIISWNLKRGFRGKPFSIKRTALHRNSTFFEVLSINPVNRKGGLTISFKSKKRFTTCFSLDEGNTSQFTTEKSTIQMGQGGPSIWIVDKAKKVKNQLINAALVVSGKSTPLTKKQILENEYSHQKFENQLSTFGTYKLQKHFSKIELSLRQGCQLFTIYVVGSFCWLYLTQYSSGTSPLNGSKINFLFQEILLKNLPLLSEKGMLFDLLAQHSTTTATLNSNNSTKSNLKLESQKANIISSSNLTKKVISIELTPSFQEKLQNFYGKKYLKSEQILNIPRGSKMLQKSSTAKNVQSTSSTEELLFFARKPIFIKGFVSTFPSHPTALIKERHSFAILKQDVDQKGVKIISHNSDRPNRSTENINQIFLQNKLLSQKKIYNLASTCMRIDPEIDILPRKLEGIHKIQLKVTKTTENKSLDSASGKKLDQIIFRKLKPQLDLGEKAFWCDTLIQTKRGAWFNRNNLSFHNKSVLWGNIVKNSSHYSKEKAPLLVTGLKSRKIPSTWLTFNSFHVAKSLQGPVAFAQRKWGVNIMLVKSSLQTKYQLGKRDSLLVFTMPSNYGMASSRSAFARGKGAFSTPYPTDLLKIDPVEVGVLKAPLPKETYSSIFLKKKKILKNKGQKWIIANQPRLHSGFNFPNVPIFQKNKENLKEGLGLAINPQFQEVPIKAGILSPQGSFLDLNNKSKNLTSLVKQFDLTNYNTLVSNKKINKGFYINDETTDYAPLAKGFFNKNPFYKWVYEQNPTSEYIAYSRANNKSIHLQKNSARFVVLDQYNDFKIINSLGGKKKVSWPYLFEENTFIENMFSSKRKSFNGLLDSPENFFGTPYLKLGERFTIEKIKGKNQISTLSNIHNGDFFTPMKKFSPYASMGTSLNTVFGKKRSQTKKMSKIPHLITNARLVMDWSKESLESKKLSRLLSNNYLKNDLCFSGQNEQKGSTWPTDQAYAKILKIFSFKRISGKVNRNIKLPFKYYNPGIKRERNIEDTMLILEGYKKSRLFPTIHNQYRGIATRGLPLELEIEKLSHKGFNIDLQSILEGMRQRTESQRIAENLSEPSNRRKITKKSEQEEIDLLLDKKSPSAYQNKQKRRLSNYYPLCTSLTIGPEASFPQRVLGSTDRVDSNVNIFNVFPADARTNAVRGSIQTKGFYFEKLLGSGMPKALPILNFIERGLISPNFLGKILFFAGTWYSYKLLATPLTQSTQFLPATFTEAVGLQSFQQKYRIIKGDTRQTFKNLAGAEKTLSELRDLIWTFRLVGTGSPNLKHNFFTFFPYVGRRIGQCRSSSSKSRNRFLLAGPPGTGKTLLVKALAAEANLPVIVQPVSGLRMISGVENPVSALFHVARQIKPCIIFLDELDTLGNDINVATSNSSAEQKLGIRLARKYTYTLLLELDGLTSSTRDLLIIGATNRLETLNPALTRAGRFETILNFNLPSQEVRTVLFSFYLAQAKKNKKLLSNLKKTTSKLIKQKQKNRDLNIRKKNQKGLNFFQKKENQSIWLESYLAKKCYGLSHASIGTIINESALESMLQDNSPVKPLHTVETLERAINSVKTLTSRATFQIFNAKDENILSNQLTLNLKSEKKIGQNPDYSHIKPFQQEFLVNRVYQTVGSLIYCFKSAKNKITRKPTTYHPASSSLFFNKVPSVHNTAITINHKNRPITRNDLQNHLLQEYSGLASLCIYNVAKPQTLKFTAPNGLYQDPSYVAAIILTLNLTHKNGFTHDITKENTLNNDLNCEYIFSTKLGLTKDNWAQFSGFTSENNLTKRFFPATSNLEAYSTNQKSILFWNNRKFFKNSFNGNVFTSHQNQVPQPLLLDVKYNPLTTSWFRIYLSRPFFRYDTFHYIENKEYYPKNNYILKRNTGIRNVSTLSHTTLYNQSSLSDYIKTRAIKSINSLQLEKQISCTLQKQIPTKDLSKYIEKKGKFLSAECEKVFEKNSFSSFLKHNLIFQSKESIYLAIVASIFHQNIQFFKKKRELTDYCAYIFLRYGMLYEFYLDQIIKKF